ncbi:hypothetical protein GXW74_12780 [Roseomonas eburnea]|uniref:Uncharacterized protein n=1 Tax=Neoroseomonas eburnea TaxID=1346889 RepID=A0A9X9XCC7_9PROT|nr:hypothetical protein [Neoroseomonas eburnea]MBR0681363.1 hypothetical protein [Neoroseomonas eburnea]
MPHRPLTQSMMDLLSNISLPAAGHAAPGADALLTDPATPLTKAVDGSHGLLDALLGEVEEDLREGRALAAGTALGLAATRISLDAVRGAPHPRHVEWLAAHLRTAAKELAEGHPGKALKAVRLARLALRT